MVLDACFTQMANEDDEFNGMLFQSGCNKCLTNTKRDLSRNR